MWRARGGLTVLPCRRSARGADPARRSRRCLGGTWVYRYKDLRGCVGKTCITTIGGVRAGGTDWLAKPGSKPIRFTEYGGAAVGQGTKTNPTVSRPQSSESQPAAVLTGARDELNADAIICGRWPVIGRDAEKQPSVGRLCWRQWGCMTRRPLSGAWETAAALSGFFPNNQTLWDDGQKLCTRAWLNETSAGAALSCW